MISQGCQSSCANLFDGDPVISAHDARSMPIGGVGRGTAPGGHIGAFHALQQLDTMCHLKNRELCGTIVPVSFPFGRSLD
jgi:hypothetical protein